MNPAGVCKSTAATLSGNIKRQLLMDKSKLDQDQISIVIKKCEELGQLLQEFAKADQEWEEVMGERGPCKINYQDLAEDNQAMRKKAARMAAKQLRHNAAL